MSPQTTLRRPAQVAGPSLHDGGPCAVVLRPAPAGHGIRFVSRQGEGAIPARVDHVTQTNLATTLSNGRWSIATVEHLLAALAGQGVDNVEIEVDGREIPALDGSALPWVDAIETAGLTFLAEPRRVLVVQEPIELRQGDRFARLLPSAELELAARIDFPHPKVGRQELDLTLREGDFARELAWARTFGFLSEVEQMRRMGLAQGGGLHNAVVFGEDGPLNPEGLRSPDELVRHKLLDMMGDLALVGRPVRARMEADRPGHALTVALVALLLREPGCYRLDEAPAAAAR